jgi:hypothetical protein
VILGRCTNVLAGNRLTPLLFAEFAAMPPRSGTCGAQAGLKRAVAGLDTGIETASPRLQAVLYRLAGALAGGVETLIPRVQDRLKRVAPKAAADIVNPSPVQDGLPASQKRWWIAGLWVMVAAE